MQGVARTDLPWNLTEEELLTARYNNIAYYSIMVPVGITGNIFTLTAVIMVLKIKLNIPNLLIGVLACTDLFSILTCHLISMASMVQGHYIGSMTLCQFQSMMTYSYFKMGFLTKCCISLDRFLALAFPLRYRRLVSLKKVIFVLIFSVVFSFGTSAMTLVVDGEHIHQLPTWYMCVNDFDIYTTYKLSIVIGEGAVFAVGVILYFVSNLTVIKVVISLNKRSHVKLGRLASFSGAPERKRQGSECFLQTMIKSLFMQRSAEISSNKVSPELTRSARNSIEPSETTELDNSNLHTKQKKQQRELQLAKLVTIIVSVFMVLWLPYMAVIYWEHYNRKSVHPFLEDIVIKLVFANACINPILYGVFNANFRRAYVYYIRMMAFHFTCRMTQRPLDNRQEQVRLHTKQQKELKSVQIPKYNRRESGVDTEDSDMPSTDHHKSIHSLNCVVEHAHSPTHESEYVIDILHKQAVHNSYKTDVYVNG